MVDQDDKDPEAVLAESGSEGAASEEVSAEASSSEGGEAVETVEASEADALEEAPAASEGMPEAPVDAPKETEGAESLSAASVSALLDAAETANDVAQAAERIGRSFQGGMTELNSHLGGIQKLNKTIVYAMGGILFLGLLVFVYMATSLTVRLSRLDATLEAVGTRVVKQAAGLRELEQIRESMGVVAETQRELLLAQDRLTVALQDAQQRLESLPSTVPSALEPRIDSALAEGMGAINSRVDRLGTALGAQDAVLKGTTEAVEAMAKRLQTVDARSRALLRLESDVQALVTLSRERYLEVLEAQLAVGDTGPRLRYPPAEVRLGDPTPENRALTEPQEGRSEP
jgi:hypothetical protein